MKLHSIVMEVAPVDEGESRKCFSRRFSEYPQRRYYPSTTLPVSLTSALWTKSHLLFIVYLSSSHVHWLEKVMPLKIDKELIRFLHSRDSRNFDWLQEP